MRTIFLAIVAAQVAYAAGHAQVPSQPGVTERPSQTTPTGGQTPNATGMAVKAFQDRLQEYVAFRNKVETTVPQLTETSDPSKISAREHALGEGLIKARGNARPGEYFIKEIQPLLRQLINADFAKRTPAERRALVVELPVGAKVTVNSLYPTMLPLATFPPKLLKAFPDLPPELEYRMVYRELILRDVEANYVVDIMPEAFPIPK